MRNEITLDGCLVDAVHVRYSPAGVPIARFGLSHAAPQFEAGAERQISFLIGVRLAGERVVRTLGEPRAGCRLRVSGFLARSRAGEQDSRLVIVASHVEWLAPPEHELE